MKDHAKNGASKSSGEGVGRKGKEMLADKPQDFENCPLGLSCLSAWPDIILMLSSAVINSPIKCLALRGSGSELLRMHLNPK